MATAHAVRRHVANLRAAKIPLSGIAQRAGLSVVGVQQLLRADLVPQAEAARILGIALTPTSSTHATQPSPPRRPDRKEAHDRAPLRKALPSTDRPTVRFVEVLEAIRALTLSGWSSADIAHELSIDQSIVQRHRARLAIELTREDTQ